MSTMLYMSVMMSAAFTMMKHPLSAGLILMMQATLISLITGNMNMNFWFSYIILLIMVGGMMVLFMYMTSIASNEKFKANMKMMVIVPMSTIMMATFNEYCNKITMHSNMMSTSHKLIMSTSKYTFTPMNMLLMTMMTYLLLVLIATVKITLTKKGPLRQMN